MTGDVGGELPTLLITECAGLGGSRTEICSAATLRKVLEMYAHVFRDGSAGTLGTVDAVDGGLFTVGHHDGVAQDVGEEISTPTGALQPSLPAQRVDHVVGGLRA